jgi:hypothetical protein
VQKTSDIPHKFLNSKINSIASLGKVTIYLWRYHQCYGSLLEKLGRCVNLDEITDIKLEIEYSHRCDDIGITPCHMGSFLIPNLKYLTVEGSKISCSGNILRSYSCSYHSIDYQDINSEIIYPKVEKMKFLNLLDVDVNDLHKALVHLCNRKKKIDYVEFWYLQLKKTGFFSLETIKDISDKIGTIGICGVESYKVPFCFEQLFRSLWVCAESHQGGGYSNYYITKDTKKWKNYVSDWKIWPFFKDQEEGIRIIQM